MFLCRSAELKWHETWNNQHHCTDPSLLVSADPLLSSLALWNIKIQPLPRYCSQHVFSCEKWWCPWRTTAKGLVGKVSVVLVSVRWEKDEKPSVSAAWKRFIVYCNFPFHFRPSCCLPLFHRLEALGRVATVRTGMSPKKVKQTTAAAITGNS